VEEICLFNFHSLKVRSISNQSIVDVGSSSITRLPMLMPTVFTESVFWIRGGAKSLSFQISLFKVRTIINLSIVDAGSSNNTRLPTPLPTVFTEAVLYIGNL
jgi:hypothetical protein